MQLIGLDSSSSHILLWGKQAAEIYQTDGVSAEKTASFPCDSPSMALHKDSIFRCSTKKVEVLNLAGTIKQTLDLEEHHGDPVCLDVNGDFLAVLTSNRWVRLWKLGGREAKPWQGKGRAMDVHGEPLGDIESIRCNCNGTKVIP